MQLQPEKHRTTTHIVDADNIWKLYDPRTPISDHCLSLSAYLNPLLQLARSSYFPILDCNLPSNFQHVSGLFQLQDSLALDFGEAKHSALTGLNQHLLCQCLVLENVHGHCIQNNVYSNLSLIVCLINIRNHWVLMSPDRLSHFFCPKTWPGHISYTPWKGLI